jgi:plasmid stabilization system protein ParE
VEIVWTAPARRDLRAHLVYLAERSPLAARKTHAAIREAVERLADFPQRGRPGRLEGTRETVVAGTPYLVVYRTRETSRRILRVLHGAQDWPPASSQ